MADIVDFPPPKPPQMPEPPPPSEAEADLLNKWRGLSDAAAKISAIVESVGHPRELTDDQRFALQWQMEFLLCVTDPAGAKVIFLPRDEYRRRREIYLRALGLGRFV